MAGAFRFKDDQVDDVCGEWFVATVQNLLLIYIYNSAAKLQDFHAIYIHTCSYQTWLRQSKSQPHYMLLNASCDLSVSMLIRQTPKYPQVRQIFCNLRTTQPLGGCLCPLLEFYGKNIPDE